MESSYSFVRKSNVNEQPPPLTQVGITGWLWRNLFSSMSNFSSISSSILSILMISLTIWLLYFCGGLYAKFNSVHRDKAVAGSSLRFAEVSVIKTILLGL